MRSHRAGGIISAGHPVTVSAGLEILEAGGNAVDAAVAAAFTSMVAEPMLTDLGGGGYMLTASSSRKTIYDFFVRAPGHGFQTPKEDLNFREIEIDFRGTTQRFHVGLGAAAVPGNVSGLCTAHQREGRLPLSEVMGPAIHHARNGVTVTDELGFILEIIGPIFTLDPGLQKAVSVDGRFLKPGETMDYSHVAPLLEAISREGAAAFYEGDVATAMEAASREFGGLISREDLARYETIISEPLTRKVAGHELSLNGPPATGGALVAFMLQLCEAVKDHRSLSLEDETRLLALAMHVCNEARAKYVDPLMGAGYDRDTLDDPQILRFYQERLLHAFYEGEPVLSGPSDPPVAGNTTHISVLDGQGNAAAITTSNGEGSGFMVPGCGIHLNNMLGEEDLNPRGFHLVPPGESLPSMMCPMLIDGSDGSRIVLGSGGSNRIRTALFQTTYRMMFKGASLKEAVLAPRMHVEGGVVQAESGVSSQGLERLKSAGLNINQWSTTNLYFGGVHGVVRDANGTLMGQGDPRRGGRHGLAESVTT